MTPQASLGKAPRPADARPTFRSRPYDVQNLYVSLKQWRIFHAVVDCGGFAEAAKALHLSQSTISYTVAKLQEQIGTALLRIEGRKSTLTAEGRALLDRSRHVLTEAVELENFARNLGLGWGGDVRLVVDHNFPSQMLMRALGSFSEASSGATQVRLSEITMLHADDILRDLNIDLAISERVPLGFLGEPLLDVEYLPVVRPDHPLLALGREATAADLSQQLQIGLGPPNERERSGSGPNQARRWTMSSLETAVEAVCEGLGYAWLPGHRIGKWLERRDLVRVPMGERHEYKSVLYLIHGRPWAATPAATRLADAIREQVGASAL